MVRDTEAFQYRSKDAAASRTMGPTMAKSRSKKFTSSSPPKYSSPRLRPPTTAMRLSAIHVLLCIRRFRRGNRPTISSTLVTAPERDSKGLNIRTWIRGWASRAAKPWFLARASMSSTRSRTRTPRSAASRIR